MLVSHDKNPWPWSFMAALSKALDDALIPNFQWGDHLNWTHYCQNAPMALGLVIAAEHIQVATAIFQQTGLRLCNCTPEKWCEEKGAHAPFKPSEAPRAHFTVPSLGPPSVVILCANEDMLHLFPLTPSHPNPASIEWHEDRIPLYPNRPADGEHANMFHTVRNITGTSLVKVLMLCLLFLPAEQLRQVRYPSGLLLELAIADDERSNVGDLGDASLTALWQGCWKEFGVVPRETVERLKSEARKEWQGIIQPGSSEPLLQ